MKMPIKAQVIGTMAVIAVAAMAAATLAGPKNDKTEDVFTQEPHPQESRLQTLLRDPAYCPEACFEENYFDRISPSL